MATRDFFLMIKPDGVERRLTGEIISRFEKRGFTLKSIRLFDASTISDVIREHYSAYETKSFYQDLIDFSTRGRVMVMIWNGNIAVAKSMVGATHPTDALPGTIRGDYSCSLPENLVHCSCDAESATREIELWNPILCL
jgi:nucleoside-diphosphate kinase